MSESTATGWERFMARQLSEEQRVFGRIGSKTRIYPICQDGRVTREHYRTIVSDEHWLYPFGSNGYAVAFHVKAPEGESSAEGREEWPCFVERDDVRLLRIAKPGERSCFCFNCPRPARPGHWFCSMECAEWWADGELNDRHEDEDSFDRRAWCATCNEYVWIDLETYRDPETGDTIEGHNHYTTTPKSEIELARRRKALRVAREAAKKGLINA